MSVYATSIPPSKIEDYAVALLKIEHGLPLHISEIGLLIGKNKDQVQKIIESAKAKIRPVLTESLCGKAASNG